MKRILLWLRVPAVVVMLLQNLSRQRKFLKKNIHPLLDDARETNDGTLDEGDFEKINKYYGLAVPALLGEAFCALHNKKMTPIERRAATSQGAMTGLFDDFFDKEYLSETAIENILSQKQGAVKHANERLFHLFYQDALQQVPDKELMKKMLSDVYDAQQESKKQATSSIPAKELEAITLNKGGASLLFYRTAFSPPAATAELMLLNRLGGMMQLANDIFDVYKDRENGIHTLVTDSTHISEIRRFYQSNLQMIYKNISAGTFPRKGIRKFLSMLSLGIFSRVFVCLDQLERNEASSGNRFMVERYSRKQLICDMDLKINLLRSAKYHTRLLRSI